MSCGRILENDEDEILSIPQAPSESQANRCCRCQSQEVDVHIRNTPWCRNCFSSQVTNKFAQGLRPAKEYCRPPKGQSKEAQNCGSLVVHYTDTPACLFLLDLLRRYIQSNDTRSTSKWQCPVDFSGVEVVCVGLGSSHTCFTSDTDQLKIGGASAFTSEAEECRIRRTVEDFGFKFVLLNLDDMFSGSATSAVPNGHTKNQGLVDLRDTNFPIDTAFKITAPVSPTTPLCTLLEPLTPTSRVTLISQLVFSSLLRFCAKNDLHAERPKVLLKSSTTTSMAIDTLVGVSLGGGWGIAEQIGGTSFSDNVFICRPILQMVDAEVHHYILLNNLASHSKDPPSPTTVKTSKTVTIPSLITDFITKLEGDYPMTSSVINRAANKIGYRSPNTEGTAGSTTSRICPSCRLPSDPCANSWKKSITLASHSTTEPTLQSKPDETTMNLADHLCYSCMGTFCDQSLRPSSTIQSTSPHLWTQFPDYVLDSIDQEGKTQETRNYEEMRKKIEDYLIDPDSI